MIKKVTYSLLVLVSVLTLSGCGNSNQSKNNDANSTSQQDESSKSITPTKENAIIGCYRDDKDGAAINIYGDGTGRYVFYDPDNGNTDDTFKWEKKGLNGHGYMQYKLNFNDDDISAPIIATIKNENAIILTSSDPNWNKQELYRVNGRLSLDDFLSKGPEKERVGLEETNDNDTPNQSSSNDSSINNNSNSGSNTKNSNDDPVTGNGISESEARQKAAAAGHPVGSTKGYRNANGWSFYMDGEQVFVGDENFVAVYPN
ncbi:MAG: DUF3642 domain-containing protein [Limosilactobacillus reuteri]|nr:DUF3642 domain-containing protein [Limosilactobacillus reuteri]MDY4730625.1 DUF3642 domain-containing protein [Lactobacillus amylovorus]